jgi:hypothetical protein
MNTRRKFLLTGSMATTAILTAKPFKTLATALAPVTGFTVNDNKVVLVHTGNYNVTGKQQTVKQIAALKKTTGNMVLVHAAGAVEDNASILKYDALMTTGENFSATGNNYKIVYKGNIKIGIITADAGRQDITEHIHVLSSRLKKEKNCHLVICLSHLGFKNKSSVDDLQLAEKSTDLDIIIGGHADNFSVNPVIAQNSKKAEVIIHADSGNGFDFGNIEITFDEKQNKRSVSINNLTARKA